MNTKLAVTFVVIVLALIALCGRVIYINYVDGNDYSIKVLSQQGYTSRTIPYKRGDITDRNGNVLATSVMVYNLIVDPKIILSNPKYLDPTVDALVRYFGMNESDLRTSLNERQNSSYWVVKKNLEFKDIKDYKEFTENKEDRTDEELERIQNIKGIWFEQKYKRMYPYKTLGCTVLGFANSENYATLGIEASYSDALAGVDGREYGYMDSDNNRENVVKNAQDGNTVVSTIDMNIQRICQKAIKKYMKKYKPQRIAVVIADPNTGEILAMADDQTFNLNDPYNLTGYYSKSEIEKMSTKKQSNKLNKIWSNYCITDSFEPGSTAKPFTVAAAVEEGAIAKNSTYFCDGAQSVGGFNIKCHAYEKGGHGNLNVKIAIAESCNDALMSIGFKLGADKFVDYQTRFGFGTKTGIDLPNETRGLVYGKDMGSSTLATNSFGQNFTVNMIQMTAGFGSLINGGNYYEPHVVKQVTTSDGNVVDNYAKTLVKQTVTQDTSNFIKECLREVVLTGTGSTAAIEGYTVGGKTGTAEKVDTSGKGKGRIKGEYILSFLGCVPCENPQVICYTIMDSPKDNTQATAYNTELWTYIMKQVLPYMGIEKTEKLEQKAKKHHLKNEFYADGIIEGDDGSLVLKDNKDE